MGEVRTALFYDSVEDELSETDFLTSSETDFWKFETEFRVLKQILAPFETDFMEINETESKQNETEKMIFPKMTKI